MVECPRCGFIQPEDRYCANCGLDALTYKPQPAPLYVRILNNTGVQLTLALFIVASLIFGLYKNQQNHVELTMNQAEDSQQRIAATAPTTVSAKILPSRPTDIKDPEPVTGKQATGLGANPEAEAAGDDDGGDAETANASIAAGGTATTMLNGLSAGAGAAGEGDGKTVAFTVSLVELSKEVLTGLNQVKPVRTWSQTKAWLITNFQGGQELTTFSQSLPANQTWTIDIPSKERGLQIFVTPLPGSSEAHLKVSVKTYFHWPTERPGESKNNEMTIEGPFDIPSQNHLVLTGFIRRLKNLTLTEATLIQDTPLGLMTSEAFQNNSSDLALTIQ